MSIYYTHQDHYKKMTQIREGKIKIVSLTLFLFSFFPLGKWFIPTFP